MDAPDAEAKTRLTRGEIAGRYRERNRERLLERERLARLARDADAKERQREHSRAWKARNKERCAAARSAYHAENKERERANHLEWAAANVERLKQIRAACDRAYRAANADRLRERRQSEAYKAARNARSRERYRTDPRYRLEIVVRSIFRQAPELQGIVKRRSVIPLIGCSVEGLKVRLGRRFLPGMTWENHGAWHIDHVAPCASFDLTREDEQRRCFHVTNLRPLWARDNQRKGKRPSRGDDLADAA